MTGGRGQIVAKHATFVVGTYDDVVMLFLDPSATNDPAHVHALGSLVHETQGRLRHQVRVLWVFRDAATTGTPSAGVRAALEQAAKKYEALVSRVVIVLSGEGFRVGFHKVVVQTMIAFVRPSMAVDVTTSVAAGVNLLFGADARSEVFTFCRREAGC